MTEFGSQICICPRRTTFLEPSDRSQPGRPNPYTVTSSSKNVIRFNFFKMNHWNRNAE